MPDIIKKLRTIQVDAVSVLLVVLALAFVWLLGHVRGIPDAAAAHEERLRHVERHLMIGPEWDWKDEQSRIGRLEQRTGLDTPEELEGDE